MPKVPNDFTVLLRKACADVVSGLAHVLPDKQEQAILNGAAYNAFRRSEAVSQRRKEGTFFSGPILANELARLLLSRVRSTAIVLDPTCGIGDLLIAYAQTLPIKPTLEKTLALWGERLAGVERRADLVEMTKARLVALARLRGDFRGAISGPRSLFPLIVVGDMFQEISLIKRADAFLFNPPFGLTSAHKTSTWATGQVNAAALCLDHLVRNKRSGTPIAAVLPEVLRCGTRYARFRTRLREAGCGGQFASRGRFDTWTDVDVFTTLIEHDATLGIWEAPPQKCHHTTVGEYFDARVGAVVPHRNLNKGPWHRFACARTAPAWAANYIPVHSRRFDGTTLTPPFVVIRRTSSPKDRHRAVGTIVRGKSQVAVENHLIALVPKDGRIESCMELLALLSRKEVSDHLNREIRCRHLTTASVLGIPWTAAND